MSAPAIAATVRPIRESGTHPGPVAGAESVSAELDRLLRGRAAQAARYGSEFARLWQHARERAIGGKLLRPRLLLGAYDALIAPGVSVPLTHAAVVRMAAMTEILHYAFLLHDDVIDGDLTRRGRPNLIGAVLRERQDRAGAPGETPADGAHGGREDLDRRWAETSGILMGDLFLSMAHQLVAREALPGPARDRLLDLLDHTIVESVAGEHLDVALSTGAIPVTRDAVLRMSQLKTATYTFELPLRAAAILAGADRAIDHSLARLGQALGLAFQLQDDLLSTFGHPDEHGKDAFSDLRERKETALIAHARDTALWPEIAARWGGGELSDADCRTIREQLRACGAERAVESLVADRVAQCREICSSEEAGLPRPLAAVISALVAELTGRRA
ncbi:polyprenyl synthetase family protein [Leucobacter chromiireducens]|uniref:polyprenyl synthetase family protein n=1 Tax=Leucobacter chromiireducens TaxID=283877 RepID=UPI003075E7DD